MRILVFYILLGSHLCLGQTDPDTSFNKFQFVDFNGYYDTRDLNVFTLNAKLDFNPKLSYFTVLNFFSDPLERDMNTYYMEHHFFVPITRTLPFDFTQYWVSLSGAKNDYLRYGVRWRMHDTKALVPIFQKLNLKLFSAFYPISFCEFKHPQILGQAQYVYRMKLLDKKFENRLYLGGFANQYMDVHTPNWNIQWVTEHQLGLRIWKGLHAVVEYRYNAFWQAKTGVGIGFEYFQVL